VSRTAIVSLGAVLTTVMAAVTDPLPLPLPQLMLLLLLLLHIG